MSRFLILLLVALMSLATACASPGTETALAPTAVPPEAIATEPAPAAADAVPANNAAASPTIVVTVPAPASPTPMAPTAEPSPTVEPTPVASPTAVPEAWLTPAPHAPDLQQPPYVESECSDRFPCSDDVPAWESRIRVPEGFAASYFAHITDPEDPSLSLQVTSITFGPDGLLYAATTRGIIFTVDQEGNIATFFEGLTVPTGIAFQPGTDRLYVSNRVLDRNVGGEAQVSVIENGEITTLFDGLPCCYIGMHGPNGIAFGPNGYGYVGVGGRADHGEILDGSNTQDELHPWEAAILRFSPDGGEVEVYARGFRNPYDISWDASGDLYATDNGRDGEVPDELHRVIPGAEHGYPHYDCPACFGIPEGVEIVEPLVNFTPHSVPTGISTYLHGQFPGYYNSQFVVLWTALDFAERVVRVTPDGETSTFATGFAAPMDVTADPDGSLYVVDFATGIIFRITYTGG